MAGRQALPWFQPNDADPCFCGSDRVFADCCGSWAEQR
ncbi:MAG: hypothetical protein HKN58_02985, partial [Xanthomonadales bacterium]|nr:hypothetical protein [Xanthomonadales bacterium]